MACVGAGVVLAVLYMAFRPERYVSESELFLSVTQTAEGTSRQDTLYLQQRMQSYAAVLASPALGGRVADSLDLDLSGEQVADRISVSVPADTVLLDVQVEDSSAARARQIADAVGEEFAELLASLEGSAVGPVQAVDVTTIQPASTPTSPAGPGVALLAVAGAVAGLAVGVGLAFVRAALDDTVRNGQELTALGVVHLGSIPVRERGGRRARRDPDHADALRSVRLHLLARTDAERQEGLAVTVTALGAAVDVVALSGALADVLAAGGARVVVVEAGADGHLSTPADDDGGLHSAPIPDLVELLAAGVPREAVLPEAGAVAVLRGRGGPPDPSLLHGAGVAALLAQLTARADFVLIAAPPFGARPDAEALAAASDGVLLVAEPGRTRRRALLRAVRSLETLQIRLLGVVLVGRSSG